MAREILQRETRGAVLMNGKCQSGRRSGHLWGGAWAGIVDSLTGQLLPGARIQLAVLDGLDADDGGDAENVVRIGATRNIGGRSVEAQKYLAVGIGARDVLHEFAGDVARIEVGENQHVGTTGHL